MGLFRRGPVVDVDALTAEEVIELQTLVARGELPDDPVKNFEQRRDSWAVNRGLFDYFIQQRDPVRVYQCAERCVRLRPGDPRSKMLLCLAYYQMLPAATEHMMGAVSDYHQLTGFPEPEDDPGKAALRAIHTIGLDIDTVIAEHKRLIDELLRLKLGRPERQMLERASNLNRLARDTRSGELDR
jgi:hypothetical protein